VTYVAALEADPLIAHQSVTLFKLSSRYQMPFPQPSNEAEGLSALHKLAILDTPSSPAIDRICGSAQRVFKVPNDVRDADRC
jgi:hypothetical protein